MSTPTNQPPTTVPQLTEDQLETVVGAANGAGYTDYNGAAYTTSSLTAELNSTDKTKRDRAIAILLLIILLLS